MTQPIPAALDLDAIRARVWEIDSYGGPWYFERDEDGQGWLVGYPTDHPAAGLIATVPDYGVDLAEFIAHARTDVPALLAEVVRLRAGEPWETVELRAEIKRLREHVTILEGAVDGSRISCRQWEKLAADHMLRYEAQETYVTQVERELAEASAEIERLRSGQPWEKLFRQRDEAIAERDRLRAQLERQAELVEAACAWSETGTWTPEHPPDFEAMATHYKRMIAAVDRLTPGDTASPQSARDLATAYRQLITEHDRLMARRAELILSGVDPGELLMPEVPLPPPGDETPGGGS